MNTMIALPIAAAVPTTAPAMPAQDFARDAELVSLAHRMIELLPAYRAAVAHESDRMDEFRSRMPQLGDVFRWKMTDPVSHTMERLPGRKCRLWCDLQDIERKRRIRPGTWHFVGTDEEHEAIKDDDFDETVPRPHIVHLYKKIPCKRQQNRLNKLVAALDEHTAAHDALRAELGISEAAKHAEALCELILDITDRIEQLPAHTLAGLQAKAAVLHHWNWEGRDREDDLDDEQQLIADVVEGLLRQDLGDAANGLAAAVERPIQRVTADPIFALIEAHKTAENDFRAALDHETVMERAIEEGGHCCHNG